MARAARGRKKKSKPKTTASSGRTIVSPAPVPKPVQTPATPPARVAESTLSRIWHRFWKLAAGAVGVAGALATLYQLAGGPPWPTEPAFSASTAVTPQSAASPFDVSFTVTNESGLFAVRHMRIQCQIVPLDVGLPGAPHLHIDDLRIDTTAMDARLGRHGSGSSGSYVCPLRRAIKLGEVDGADAVINATVIFHTIYESGIIPGRLKTATSDVFRLHYTKSGWQWVQAPLNDTRIQ